MTQGSTVQERRVLNDAIEATYIECTSLASGIRTHVQTGRGAVTDLYENFHYNFGILFDLTCDLDEMSKDQVVVNKTDTWLNLAPPRGGEYESRCETGREIFKEYKKSLNRCGLIALPTRGK